MVRPPVWAERGKRQPCRCFVCAPIVVETHCAFLDDAKKCVRREMLADTAEGALS